MVHYDPIEFYEDPYPTYRLLRDTAPVYHNDERSVWVLSRYDDVQMAARDWQTYSSGRGTDYDGENASLGPGDFLDLDPLRHDELRHILRNDFTPKRIKLLEDKVRATVGELIDALVERGRGDFAQDFAQRLPLTMICDLFGVPKEDHHLLEDWFLRIVGRVPSQVALSNDVWTAAAEMRDYINDAIALRRSKPREDVLSTIAAAQADGKMSADEIHGMTQILLLAGIHTTSSLIANSLLLLAPYPDERRRLTEDPQRIPVAIEELLRYESPVQWLGRTTTRDVEIHDVVIPAGAMVILLWASANRDERKFANPDTLDLKRPPVHHMAFGQGIHFCIGAPLARMEARIAFEVLFRRISDYDVVGPIERLFTRQERGISSLPVQIRAELAPADLAEVVRLYGLRQ